MARIRSNTSVVCDAGLIIHLDELGCLHLMRDFEDVMVPDGVRNEVLKYRDVAFDDGVVRWEFVSREHVVEEPLTTMCKIFSLDSGEVEALAALTKEPNRIFLTDDAAARLVAAKLGFRVHGTMGVLIRAIRRGSMRPGEVLEVLNSIPSKSSLHVKPSLLQEVFSIVRRESNQ